MVWVLCLGCLTILGLGFTLNSVGSMLKFAILLFSEFDFSLVCFDLVLLVKLGCLGLT